MGRPLKYKNEEERLEAKKRNARLAQKRWRKSEKGKKSDREKIREWQKKKRIEDPEYFKKYVNKARDNYKPKEPKTLNCFVCSKQFIWTEDLRKFCSIDCKIIHKTNQRKEFYHSDKYKEWRKNYLKLDRVKESTKKYQQSEKYQKYLEEYRSNERVKKLNNERSRIWQKDNKKKIEVYKKTEKYKVGRKKTQLKYAKSPKSKKVRERFYKTPKGENAKLWSSIRVRLKQWCGNKNVSPRSEMGTIVGCSKKQLRTY